MQAQDILVNVLASGAAAAMHNVAANQMGRVGGVLAMLVPFLLSAYVRAALRAALQTKASSPERL